MGLLDMFKKNKNRDAESTANVTTAPDDAPRVESSVDPDSIEVVTRNTTDVVDEFVAALRESGLDATPHEDHVELSDGTLLGLDTPRKVWDAAPEDARKTAMAEYVGQIKHAMEAKDTEPTHDNVLPRLVRTTKLNGMGGDFSYADEFVPGTSFALTTNQNGSTSYLDIERVAPLGDVHETLAAAMKNFTDRMGEVPLGVDRQKTDTGAELVIVHAEDPYISTLALMMDQVVETTSADANTDLGVFFILPSDSVMMYHVCDESSNPVEMINGMAGIVAQATHEDETSVCPNILFRRGGTTGIVHIDLDGTDLHISPDDFVTEALNELIKD